MTMDANIQRTEPRLQGRFRVRSRDLPGYQALTEDYSRTGVQLETENELTLSSRLRLEFDFDREDLENFSCLAQVVWTSPAPDGRHFRSGLTFLPQSEQEQILLARTATVLQARSAQDLEALLEEAKKLDPERAQTFARVRQQKDLAVATPGQATSGKRVLPLLGVYIPIHLQLESYHWQRSDGMLLIDFTNEGHPYRLYFPECRLLTDYGCSQRIPVVALFCTPHSEAIKQLPKPSPAKGWKHYRFLSADGQPILELISTPCQSRLHS